MNERAGGYGLARFIVGIAIVLASSGLAAGESGRVPEAQFTDNGVAGCLRCHAGDAMVVMGETVHGREDDPHAPFAQQGCESCHGPGSLHVSRARGGAGFPPLTRFREDGDPIADQLGACLACHGDDMGEHEGMVWAGSLHDTGTMSCSTCHQVHTAENVLADPVQQKANCATCHEAEIESHNRFEGKGILFDRLTCHDCHDVHQLIGRQ